MRELHEIYEPLSYEDIYKFIKELKEKMKEDPTIPVISREDYQVLKSYQEKIIRC